MPGLERAIDEAGNVQFRPFSPLSLSSQVVLLLVFSSYFSEFLDCPFNSCLTFSSILFWIHFLLLSYRFFVTHRICLLFVGELYEGFVASLL